MIFYSLCYGVFFAAGKGASLFSRKLRAGYEGRRGLTRRVQARCGNWEGGCFWFHVSSSGELEQALPIMDEVRRRHATKKIFLSYFSPTGGHAVRLETERREKRGRKVPWDAADFSPADFKKDVVPFIEALRPACFVAIHREVWPRLVLECETRNIPCYLFAAFFSKRSHKWWPAYRRTLGRFTWIGTIEAESQRFLADRLPSRPVEIVGDSRVERVLARRELQGEAPWKFFFEGQNVLIFASLWPKDFTALQPTLRMLLARHPDWRLVLTPHEPTETFTRELFDWFRAEGSQARYWSRWCLEPDHRSHLIVDNVGLLAELYSVGSLVFVGGSFSSRVHNVLEPAAYGRPIFTGPFIQNSNEATEMASHGDGLTQVNDGEELAREIESFISEPERMVEQKKRLGDYLQKRVGASKHYADILEKVLK